jgi:hypothetical protein
VGLVPEGMPVEMRPATRHRPRIHVDSVEVSYGAEALPRSCATLSSIDAYSA